MLTSTSSDQTLADLRNIAVQHVGCEAAARNCYTSCCMASWTNAFSAPPPSALVLQLCGAYEGSGGRTIVVLTQRSKLEMENLSRKAIPGRCRRVAGGRVEPQVGQVACAGRLLQVPPHY